MNFIFTSDALSPGGHYSQAVKAGGFTFVSGMLPGPGVATDGPDNFERQVRATLQHCTRVLAAAGCSLTDVAQCTAYIVGIGNWPHFNRIYAEVFGEHRPARAVVPVPELHHGFLVEVQMTAFTGA
ncbi:RidA family protein [Paraburkholderia sartisoli]|uniref:Enamine deaminase RidA, house cleaning of reactive enamine intermediates, YjgF/YER057c/UK114 family n=1 Tax=Paraburkholderia sartisoli TaxID=83784 RepID=A0A1H4CM39_9BURK|nr:RidA family protein [Paraburkholderia sartisoli]SEA61389.1 Enamine deaminase RidA, house cleaning of reactive enamine intermediates, YjgF/YER057c/UK114 family [Paraburkholderia sartisoli]